ncbi:MAG TPA: hypothetical protein ENK52_04970 [Saprospiraceae bacterium]|nr:hypothetical protein [Saprospiraceae bacterium]
MTYRKKIDINPFNSIISILALVVAFVALYWIASSIFTLLSWTAPILLLVTAVIDYNIILNYGKWILHLLKTNTIMGIAAILLSFFGFPVISGFLFVKALLLRKVIKLKDDIRQKEEGEYVDYEELDSNPTLELPQMKKERPKQSSTDYDGFFED